MHHALIFSMLDDDAEHVLKEGSLQLQVYKGYVEASNEYVAVKCINCLERVSFALLSQRYNDEVSVMEIQ